MGKQTDLMRESSVSFHLTEIKVCVLVCVCGCETVPSICCLVF